MHYKVLNLSLKTTIPEGTTVLDFSGIDLINTELSAITNFIAKSPDTVTQISFAGINLSQMGAESLGKIIKKSSPNIKVYDFRDCELTDKHINEIIKKIYYSNVETVHVDDHTISLKTKLHLLWILQENIEKNAAQRASEAQQEPGSSRQHAASSFTLFGEPTTHRAPALETTTPPEDKPGTIQTDEAIQAWIQAQHFQFNPNTCIQGNKTLLYIASKYGYKGLVQLLISMGAAIDGISADSKTALMAAIKQGNTETAKLLIAFKANIKPQKADQSLLFTASQTGAIGIVLALLAAGAEVNKAETIIMDGTKQAVQCTPLYIATQNGHTDVVEALLNNNAIPNPDLTGQCYALHIAAQCGHTRIVELLLAHGALVNALNEHETTALMLAAAKGHTEVVTLLEKAGAIINQVNNKKYTALYASLEGGHHDTAMTLMNAGATFAASCSPVLAADTNDPLKLIKTLSAAAEKGKSARSLERKLASHTYSINYLYQVFYLSLAMKSPNAVQYASARAVLAQISAPKLLECGTTASFKLWAFSQRKRRKSLISLDLSAHGLIRIPPEQIIEIITAYDSSLKGLDLGENFLGMGMPYPLLLETIKALPSTLEYLGLKGTGLCHIPFEQLMELFQALPKLKQLDLRDNNFEFIAPKNCLALLNQIPDSLVTLLFDGNGFESSYRRREGAEIIRKVEEINARKTSSSSTSQRKESSIETHIKHSIFARNNSLSAFGGRFNDSYGPSFR